MQLSLCCVLHDCQLRALLGASTGQPPGSRDERSRVVMHTMCSHSEGILVATMTNCSTRNAP